MSEYHKYLSDISPETTNHGSGLKYVFLSNEAMNSPLTQIAYGQFQSGERCEEHVHATMDECFFFLKGRGNYLVGDVNVELLPNTFLRIPAGTKHSLVAGKEGPLEFVYWGVATG